jgi:hypothetical protein
MKRRCANCGTEFVPRESKPREGWTQRFCNSACSRTYWMSARREALTLWHQQQQQQTEEQRARTAAFYLPEVSRNS